MQPTPLEQLEQKENRHKFLCLCSLVSITQNKKINLANVLLIVLKNKHYGYIFKEILQINNEYELVQTFLKEDPFLYKSKYITNSFKNGKFIRKSI